MSVGIAGYGVYIPRYRIKSEEIAKVWGGAAPGVVEKSVAGTDEDSITMAVEAAENALKFAGVDASHMGGLYVASVSSPYIMKSMAAIIAEVLGVSPNATIADFGGSTRADAVALQAGIDLINSGRAGYVMIIASDSLKGQPGDLLEHLLGAGAAAYVLSKDNYIAELEGFYSQSSTHTYIWRCDGDHFVRRHDDPRFDRELGYPKLVTDAAVGLMKQINTTAEDFNQAVFHQPDGQLPLVPARSLGIKREAMAHSSVAQYIGSTGCSSAFIGLASALDNAKPGERILVTSYGSGAGSDAFSCRVMASVQERTGDTSQVKHYIDVKEYIDYPTYEKRMGILKEQKLPQHISSYLAEPDWEKEKQFVLGLKALNCKRCGSMNFPKRHYCLDCRGEEFDEVPLPRRGTILIFNIQHVVAVSPEEAPIPLCVARMDGAKGEHGGKIAAMMTDTKPDEIAIGMPVSLVIRRCGQELGLVRYGYKFKLI